ncbi:MAG: GNAT family N-acetyltransferase [Roseovarius sp.]|nr:GNAT family N-acetyltransferase [Roseovarius sp.]MCY4291656.1 GNAT family N-acetyltransferase [Roseovarius sp.]MCY4315852.1 GNAT family N-acetyltransferase [Roseovarius sp.]
MDGGTFSIKLHGDLKAIHEKEWDCCACPETADGGRPEDPFTTYRFLKALEDSGSIGPGTGWQAYYITVEHDGETIACAPLYAKGHSQGEYIFDHVFAHAYESAGGKYYPKFQIAVPFTPVTGRRFLTRPDYENAGRAALAQGLLQLADKYEMSSAHVTFCTSEEARWGAERGFLPRLTHQFRWLNNSYSDFNDFLAGLSSRKRKNIKKERDQARGFGGRIEVFHGGDIREEHWDAMWRFYQDTCAAKWGNPYLTRDFFIIARETLKDDMALIIASRETELVAGAMHVIGRNALFGRYWGSKEYHPSMHFELCYYQAIDYAIALGLERLEAGAQGGHKLARGYMPFETHSLHWFRNKGFSNAVSEYLEREHSAVSEDMEVLTAWGPFRKTEYKEQI